MAEIDVIKQVVDEFVIGTQAIDAIIEILNDEKHKCLRVTDQHPHWKNTPRE